MKYKLEFTAGNHGTFVVVRDENGNIAFSCWYDGIPADSKILTRLEVLPFITAEDLEKLIQVSAKWRSWQEYIS